MRGFPNHADRRARPAPSANGALRHTGELGDLAISVTLVQKSSDGVMILQTSGHEHMSVKLSDGTGNRLQIAGDPGVEPGAAVLETAVFADTLVPLASSEL